MVEFRVWNWVEGQMRVVCDDDVVVWGVRVERETWPSVGRRGNRAAIVVYLGCSSGFRRIAVKQSLLRMCWKSPDVVL